MLVRILPPRLVIIREPIITDFCPIGFTSNHGILRYGEGLSIFFTRGKGETSAVCRESKFRGKLWFSARLDRIQTHVSSSFREISRFLSGACSRHQASREKSSVWAIEVGESTRLSLEK